MGFRWRVMLAVAGVGGVAGQSMPVPQDILTQGMQGPPSGYHLGDDKGVCWVTGVEGTNNQVHDCDTFGISLAFDGNTPSILTFGDSYTFKYTYRVAGAPGCDMCIAGMPVNTSLPSHSNLHFCTKKVAFCDPFYGNDTPFATHSTAETIVLTPDGTGGFANLDSTIDTSRLEQNAEYTMIAHVYVTTENTTTGETLRWDVAIGYRISVEQVQDLGLYPTGVVVLAYLAFSVLILTVFGIAIWLKINLKTKVVMYSQPLFLSLILIGAFVSAFSIIFAGIQDSPDALATPEGGSAFEDFSCNAKYWFSVMGFAILFGTLFAKIYRAYIVVINSEKLRNVSVSARSMLLADSVIALLFVTILAVWSGVQPLVYTREQLHIGVSVGRCTGGGAFGVFIGVIYGFQFSLLLLGVVLAYKSVGMNSILNESKYVGFAMISLFQVKLLATPLIYLVTDNQTAVYLIWTADIFFNTMCILLFVFGPKIRAVYLKEEIDLRRKRTGKSMLRSLTSGAEETRDGSYNSTVEDGLSGSGDNKSSFHFQNRQESC